MFLDTAAHKSPQAELPAAAHSLLFSLIIHIQSAMLPAPFPGRSGHSWVSWVLPTFHCWATKQCQRWTLISLPLLSFCFHFHLIQRHALVKRTSAGRVVNGAYCWHLSKWQLDAHHQAVARKTMVLLIALNKGALLSTDLLCCNLRFLLLLPQARVLGW